MLFERCGVVQHRIEAVPDAGGVTGQAEASLSKNIIDNAQAALEHVQHLHLHVVGDLFQRVGHVAGRRIMSVAEPGRQDQDFFHAASLSPRCDNRVAFL